MAAESLRHLRCVQLRTSNSCLEELIYFRLAQVSHGNIQLPPALPPLSDLPSRFSHTLRFIESPILKMHTLLAGTWYDGATSYKDSIRFAARASGAVLGKS